MFEPANAVAQGSCRSCGGRETRPKVTQIKCKSTIPATASWSIICGKCAVPIPNSAAHMPHMLVCHRLLSTPRFLHDKEHASDIAYTCFHTCTARTPSRTRCCTLQPTAISRFAEFIIPTHSLLPSARGTAADRLFSCIALKVTTPVVVIRASVTASS